MKHLALLFVFLVFAGPAAAQTGTWTPLFNGKSLAGWTQKGGQATFTVEKGVLTGASAPNTPNSFLCTNAEYSAFILELDLAIDDGLNSGIQIRSQARPDLNDGRVFGLQVEVDPSARAWSGGIYDEGRREWLYIPNINPEGKKAFRTGGRWNHYRVEAIGNTIRTWINGVPVAFLVDTLEEKGFIALQVHAVDKPELAGKKVRWRNIRIQTGRQMRPSPWDGCPVQNFTLDSLCDQEKRQGWRLLFNGKDLDGWHTAFQTAAPAEGWTVHDGVLSIQGSDGSEAHRYGDILTRDSFAAFELVFDFRLTEGANSGVKYFVDEKYDPKGGSAIGLEYQLLDDERHPDAKLGAAGNRTLASLYDLIPSYKLEKRFQRPIGAWNQGRIVARPDGIVQHWLNGFKVVEYERGSNIFAALVARSKYAVWEGFGQAKSGPILLQDHGHTVYFKNIKIRNWPTDSSTP